MTKKCYHCKKIKKSSEFNKNATRADGLNTLCKKCNIEYQRNWYSINKKKHKKNTGKQRNIQRNRSRRFVVDYLKKHSCVDCGESDIIVLDFDHVKGKKLNNISSMVGYGCSISSLEKEISKCEIRCANCHRRKTAKNLDWCYKIEMQ